MIRHNVTIQGFITEENDPLGLCTTLSFLPAPLLLYRGIWLLIFLVVMRLSLRWGRKAPSGSQTAMNGVCFMQWQDEKLVFELLGWTAHLGQSMHEWMVPCRDGGSKRSKKAPSQVVRCGAASLCIMVWVSHDGSWSPNLADRRGVGGVWAHLELCLHISTSSLFFPASISFPLAFVTAFSFPTFLFCFWFVLFSWS